MINPENLRPAFDQHSPSTGRLANKACHIFSRTPRILFFDFHWCMLGNQFSYLNSMQAAVRLRSPLVQPAAQPAAAGAKSDRQPPVPLFLTL